VEETIAGFQKRLGVLKQQKEAASVKLKVLQQATLKSSRSISDFLLKLRRQSKDSAGQSKAQTAREVQVMLERSLYSSQVILNRVTDIMEEAKADK
jgi:hypothetical protein